MRLLCLASQASRGQALCARGPRAKRSSTFPTLSKNLASGVPRDRPPEAGTRGGWALAAPPGLPQASGNAEAHVCRPGDVPAPGTGRSLCSCQGSRVANTPFLG